MMKNKKTPAIAVVGTTFTDIKGFPHNKYIPGGRNAGNIAVVHGGVGRNVAVDIARAGCRSRFVSLVDDTEMGNAVIHSLKELNVDTEYVSAAPNGMGMWLAVFDDTGDVAGSISKRPDLSAVKKLLQEKGDLIFSDIDSLAIEIDLEPDIVEKSINLALKYAKPIYAVIGNMSIALERIDLIRKTDCIVCNEQEASMLFDKEFDCTSPEMIGLMLPDILEQADISSAVVTLGERGAVFADAKGLSGYCPALPTTVRDTTGAGDAFFSGVVAGLSSGRSMKEAVKAGTRLASSVITSSENICPEFSEKGLYE